MAYNKDLLKAAGIDKPADTWDGLAEQAKKLTSGDVHGMAIAYADSFDPWKFVWAMSMQAGQHDPRPAGQEGARSTTPPSKKAYETYFGWLTDDKVVDPAAIGWKNAQAVAAFAERARPRILPMVSSSSQVTLDKSGVAGKYAYAVMPTIPPGETSLPSDGKAAATHHLGRQHGRREVLEEPGPRVRAGQDAHEHREPGEVHQDVRRPADQRRRGEADRAGQRTLDARSSTPAPRRSARRSPAPGATRSWPS